MRFESRPTTFLVFLLAGALALSLGLNGFLLSARNEAGPDDTELAETTADLRLTQRLLDRCQAAHQQQDSLLTQLRTRAPSPAFANE